MNQTFLTTGNLNATESIELCLMGCPHYFRESDIPLFECRQIHLYLGLLEIPAVDCDLSDAGDGEQRILIGGLNQRTQLKFLVLRSVFGEREGVLQDGAEGESGGEINGGLADFGN